MLTKNVKQNVYRPKNEIVLKPDKSKPYTIKNIFSCKLLNNNFYHDLRNI